MVPNNVPSPAPNLKDFDTEAYLGPKRVRNGGDGFTRNKFNQIASDNLPIDRSVPDTRSYGYG